MDVEKSKPLHYSLTLDNRGSEAVGPFQLDMGATFENLLQPNSETSLRLINASLSQELLYVTAQHSVVLNGEGTKLTFGLKASNSVPGTDPLTAIDLKTDARTATVELSHPFIRSRNLNLQGLLGFEARDSKTYTLGVPLSLDRTRILRFGLDFDNTDAKGGTNTISAELSHGLLGLGANPTGDPLNSRQFGRADFTKLTLDLSRTQDLGALSPKFANWSVNGKITAQMTGDPLLSSEECAIGGAQYGRAFDSSTLSGDRCAAAGLEMRYQMQKTGPLSSLQLFGFYDIGGVSNLDPGSPAGTQHLASTGLGARFGFGKGYSGSIEIDKQLKNSGGGIVDTNPRIFISMKGEF